MIVHQAPAQARGASALQCGGEKLQIGAAVAVVEKQALPPVAALDDMMGDARKYDSGRTRHEHLPKIRDSPSFCRRGEKGPAWFNKNEDWSTYFTAFVQAAAG